MSRNYVPPAPDEKKAERTKLSNFDSKRVILHTQPINNIISPVEELKTAALAKETKVLANSLDVLPPEEMKTYDKKSEQTVSNKGQQSWYKPDNGPANPESISYTKITGFFQDTPAIVLSTEFLPVSTGTTDIDADASARLFALNTKEKAILLTAQNAINVLSKKDATKLYVADKKKEIIDFATRQSSRATTAITTFVQAAGALDVKSFKHTPKTEPTVQKSFADYLAEYGWGSSIYYKLPTTIYQQFLLELHRSLVSHTPTFYGGLSKPEISDLVNDLNLYTSDAEAYALQSKIRGLFQLTNLGTIVPDSSKYSIVDAPLYKRATLSRANLVSAASLESFVRIPVGDLAKLVTSPNESEETNYLQYPQFFKQLNSLPDFNFNLLKILLSKEVKFSRALKISSVSQDLQQKYGYTIAADDNAAIQNGNQKVWASLIGSNFNRDPFKFNNVSTTSLDFSLANSVPSNLTLLALSKQKYRSTVNPFESLESNPQYNVLTFENANIPYIDEEQENLTHGAYFYLDRSMSVVSTRDKFDLTNLNQLQKLGKSTHETIRLIKRMYTGGASDTGSENIYSLLETSNSEDVIKKAVEKTLPLRYAYRTILKVDDKGQVIFDEAKRREALCAGQTTGERKDGPGWQKQWIVPASIIKYAVEKDDIVALRLLFHIVCREVLKKSTGLTVNYPAPKKVDAPKLAQEAKDEYRKPGVNSPETILDLWLYSQTRLAYRSDHNKKLKKTAPQNQSLNVYASDLYAVDIDPNFHFFNYRMFKSPTRPGLLSFYGTGRFSEETSGLFKTIVELLEELYLSDIYRAPKFFASSFTTTAYAGIPQLQLLWNYFLTICSVISQSTIDTFQGFYNIGTVNQQEAGGETINFGAPKYCGYYFSDDYNEKAKTLWKMPMDKYDPESDFPMGFAAPEALSKSNEFYDAENNQLAHWIHLLEKFVMNINNKAAAYKTALEQDFRNYLLEAKTVYDNDTNLSEESRVQLTNLSFIQEQIILSDYCLSELNDRFSQTNASEGVLRTYPDFIPFTEGFIDYFPVNDFDLVSYTTMSKFFDNPEFFRFKGNNKRILSVGLTPRLLRNLVGETGVFIQNRQDYVKRNLLRISVYKNDIRYPGLVFKPKSFVFEANRFPTRVATNYSNISSIKETGNPYIVPTKFFNGLNFVLHKNRLEAYEDYSKDNSFPETDRNESYKNHVTSFLLEQYIKWFTRFSVDETRYYRYGSGENLNVSVGRDALKKQFQNYILTTEAKFDETNIFGDGTTQNNITDENIASLSNTVNSYFKNETLFLDADELKRLVFYPKKFDRVFNLVIDPDDFELDVYSQKVIDTYVTKGVLVKDGNTYKTVPRQPSDIYLNEYWVSIEPYFYNDANEQKY